MINLSPYNKSMRISFFVLLFLCSGLGRSFAAEIITFGPKETRIDGSIPYSLMGTYKARFGVFKGRIILDGGSRRIQSVYLAIRVDSIHSNCPWCDRAIRSRRLMNAAKYPYIFFKSSKIFHDQGGDRIKGVLEMHGIQRTMTFPFSITIINDQKYRRKMVDLKGSWTINRKYFHIIWSKLLDRGGIIVGDNFTVHWGIKAFLND
jgi:polyisoprenoid-binding protein YceI